MRPHTKRYRRCWRGRFRRLKKKALRLYQGSLALAHTRPLTDTELAKHDRIVTWLNHRISRTADFGGYEKIDGQIQCPRCGKICHTLATPQEWTRANKSKWRRGRETTWTVTDYWGGTAECCNLLLAFQPDGHAEAYDLSASQS